jgi:hypothetical protein
MIYVTYTRIAGFISYSPFLRFRFTTALTEVCATTLFLLPA